MSWKKVTRDGRLRAAVATAPCDLRIGVVVVALLTMLGGLVVAEEPSVGIWVGEVNASRLKLRAGPGEAYQEVITLAKGERVIVIGPHANAPEWLKVELPQGYEAWVFGDFVKPGEDGMAVVTGDRVLVRPRATTRYHQLMGLLEKGESLRVVDRKTTEEGLWYRIVVPRRFPLFTHGAYLLNRGAELIPEVEAAARAEKPRGTGETAGDASTESAPAATVSATDADRRFAEVERTVRARMAEAKTTQDIEPLRATLDGIDATGLSRASQERRYTLLTELVKTERALARAEFAAAEQRVLADLEARLQQIQRDYELRLQEIREQSDREDGMQFTAVGIVEYRPDLLGRTPTYRLVEAGKMRYFLIATEFELQRFAGKRVGIVGLTDPESGTGHQTLIVQRIEILGEE